MGTNEVKWNCATVFFNDHFSSFTPVQIESQQPILNNLTKERTKKYRKIALFEKEFSNSSEAKTKMFGRIVRKRQKIVISWAFELIFSPLISCPSCILELTWQKSPAYPTGQMQRNPLGKSTHSPPFLQGLLSHSLISVWQSLPVIQKLS